MLFLTLMVCILLKRIKNENYSNIKENPNYLKFNFNTKIKTIVKNKQNLLYNETNFVEDFLNNKIFLNMNMGIPSQNVKIILEPNDICFNFINNKEFSELNQHYMENNYIKINPYHLNISISSKKSQLTNSIDKFGSYNIFEIEEAFYLYQFKEDTTNKINDFYNESIFLTFSFQNEINENISYGKIGLNMNNYNDIKCQRFIQNLKNKNILKKYIWFLRFYSKFDGYFYIGPEPHLYNIKSNFYKDYQYVKINNILSKEGTSHWSLLFDKIILKNITNNNKYYLNDKMAFIEFNIGLIIGTYEYQQIIEKNFFKLLIDKNICQKNIVNYSFQNLEKEYYAYKCNEMLYQRINDISYLEYIDYFPELNFYSNNIEYSFNLLKNDLFEKINGKIYFMIIFEAKNNNKVWKLGQIFLKKHILIFDYESKVIGFYNKNIKEDFDNKKADNKTNNSNPNNFTLNKIIINSIKIIIFCIIIVVAIFIGMKIKESRKKRAYELKDDDFEYISANTNIKFKKSNQKIELNNLGI